MMNVTRNALRKTVPTDWRLRLSPNNELRAFGCFFTEQTSRLEDQDHHEQCEDYRFGPAWVDDAVGDRRRETDDHPAQESALDVADATHHGGGETVRAVAEALEVQGGVVLQPVVMSGCAAMGAADQKR